MIGQKVGNLYRTYLRDSGFIVLSENLSDEAAFDLFKELERVGFNYYPEMYKDAKKDVGNGFTDEDNNNKLKQLERKGFVFDPQTNRLYVPQEETKALQTKMDALKELFKNRSRQLLEKSGKSSDYIENNYEKFAEQLLKFCASYTVERIHTLLKSRGVSLDDFELDSEVNDMSNGDVENNLDNEVSDINDPLILIDMFTKPSDFMKVIENSINQYDDDLAKPNFSEEEKNEIRKNKSETIQTLNSLFLMFLEKYSNNLIESEDDSKKLDEEIEEVINIYRSYFHNDELADELQRRYYSFIASDDNLETEPVQDVISDFVDEKHDEVSLNHDEERETISSEDTGNKDVIEEEEVFEELDSFDDDYSDLSSDELLERSNSLVLNIEKAKLDNSANLKDLISEANRIKLEFERRLHSKGRSVASNFSSLSDDRESEADKIRNSSHFRPEDKDRLIAELYGVEEDDHHYKGSNFKR